jgi:hypothetical protein
MTSPRTRPTVLEVFGAFALTFAAVTTGLAAGDDPPKAPKEKQFVIWVNVTTPYMPIMSDGKAPDLRPFLYEITIAVGKPVKKAHRPNAASGTSCAEAS